MRAEEIREMAKDDVAARIRELEGVTPEIAKHAMALAAAKMPVRTKFITREEAHTDAG